MQDNNPPGSNSPPSNPYVPTSLDALNQPQQPSAPLTDPSQIPAAPFSSPSPSVAPPADPVNSGNGLGMPMPGMTSEQPGMQPPQPAQPAFPSMPAMPNMPGNDPSMPSGQAPGTLAPNLPPQSAPAAPVWDSLSAAPQPQTPIAAGGVDPMNMTTAPASPPNMPAAPLGMVPPVSDPMGMGGPAAAQMPAAPAMPAMPTAEQSPPPPTPTWPPTENQAQDLSKLTSEGPLPGSQPPPPDPLAPPAAPGAVPDPSQQQGFPPTPENQPGNPPGENAPTDLSHLIGSNDSPPPDFSSPQPQTAIGGGVPPVPPVEPGSPPQPGAQPQAAAATAEGGKHVNLSLILIIVGVASVLLVAGLSAYFFFGPGRATNPSPAPTSVPATEQSQTPLTNPPKQIAVPSATPAPATGSAALPVQTPIPATPSGASAIDLLKAKQSSPPQAAPSTNVTPLPTSSPVPER